MIDVKSAGMIIFAIALVVLVLVNESKRDGQLQTIMADYLAFRNVGPRFTLAHGAQLCGHVAGLQEQSGIEPVDCNKMALEATQTYRAGSP